MPQRRRYAKELIALQPDLILSHDTPTTATLLQQTRTVPIVFATVADPVGSGFVASFARSGGNATGFAVYEASLGGKWLELLKGTVPNISKVVVIFNPATAPFAENLLKSINDAATSFGVEVSVAHVGRGLINAQPLDASCDADAPALYFWNFLC